MRAKRVAGVYTTSRLFVRKQEVAKDGKVRSRQTRKERWAMWYGKSRAREVRIDEERLPACKQRRTMKHRYLYPSSRRGAMIVHVYQRALQESVCFAYCGGTRRFVVLKDAPFMQQRAPWAVQMTRELFFAAHPSRGASIAYIYSTIPLRCRTSR